MTGAVRLSVHCQSVSLCGCRACALSIQSIGLPASLAGRTVLRCSQFGSAGRRRRGRYHTNECSDAGRSVGRTDGRTVVASQCVLVGRRRRRRRRRSGRRQRRYFCALAHRAMTLPASDGRSARSLASRVFWCCERTVMTRRHTHTHTLIYARRVRPARPPTDQLAAQRNAMHRATSARLSDTDGWLAVVVESCRCCLHAVPCRACVKHRPRDRSALARRSDGGDRKQISQRRRVHPQNNDVM